MMINHDLRLGFDPDHKSIFTAEEEPRMALRR